jgi:anti-sigma factor RsiW
MDCRYFRTEHLAYLDDTLPGNVMAEARQHLLACEACAAHDRRVRRSLLLVRNLPDLEPTEAFRERLQRRLAACKASPAATDDHDDACLAPVPASSLWRGRSVWLAMAAGLAVVGTLALRGTDGRRVEPSLAPVLAAAPTLPEPVVLEFSPALLQALSTGNPMWSMVQLLDELPTHALATGHGFERSPYAH